MSKVSEIGPLRKRQEEEEREEAVWDLGWAGGEVGGVDAFACRVCAAEKIRVRNSSSQSLYVAVIPLTVELSLWVCSR
jgi:hypothetical protein